MLQGKQEREDIHRSRSLAETLQYSILCPLGQTGKLGRTPAFSEKADERTTSATVQNRIFDVVRHGEFKDTRGTPCALATSTTARAPLSACDAFVLGEFEEGVEEAVQHFLHDTGLYFVV